jgi:hypothetical protein
MRSPMGTQSHPGTRFVRKLTIVEALLEEDLRARQGQEAQQDAGPHGGARHLVQLHRRGERLQSREGLRRLIGEACNQEPAVAGPRRRRFAPAAGLRTRNARGGAPAATLVEKHQQHWFEANPEAPWQVMQHATTTAPRPVLGGAVDCWRAAQSDVHMLAAPCSSAPAAVPRP